MLESCRTTYRLLGLVSLLVVSPSSPVSATQATASGGVVIENAAGVGVSYDVRGGLLSAILLVSQPNLAILVRVDGANKQFMPGQQGVVSRDGAIVLIADELVSVSYAPVNRGLLRASGVASMIVLAQFN